MRFVSRKTTGYKIYAVTGVNSIAFAIDFNNANTKGLLGFAIERHDLTAGSRFYLHGFKVFKERIPTPGPETSVSTFEHPMQSFVWDDFTAEPDHQYDYYFHPLKGTPHTIDRSARPIKITVKTEPLFSDKTHDVFFNRGVASSQAFARRFHNQSPNQITEPDQAKAMFNWLARDLERALLRFIKQAKAGDTLLACMYEFHYLPVLEAFKQAIDRGATVRIIIDAKGNKEQFPLTENLRALKKAGIAKKHIIERAANKNDIQHNKFIVYLKGTTQKPNAIWTGSTNVSLGGIFGQTNVGHWVRDRQTAEQFARYWQLLSVDPGGKSRARAKKTAENKAFKQSVMALQQDIEATSADAIPHGITPLFSPRTSTVMLNTYAKLLDSAKTYAAITLAFGISKVFKQALLDNTADGPIIFMLLERKDMPRANAKDAFVRLTAKHNVYQAWGSYMQDPLYQWTKEVNTKTLRLNQHVMYIHSKFLLIDPLGKEPIVVTGSANFSQASTTANDENMLIIKGDRRAADIYFTEFNRLFNHYYFRSVSENTRKQKRDATAESLFLAPDDRWLKKYKPGSLRRKRIDFFVEGLATD